MRILLTGGGTAGHINPALAIGAVIKEKQPDSWIGFVGTKNGLENKLVPKEGYELYHIEIQGLKRSLSLSNIKTLYLTLTSPRKAKKLLKQLKPDLVIGTGGYVCYPLVKAASALKIPTALHESNAQPGVAVKMLAPHVDLILTNFPKTAEILGEKYKDKILNVGNPYKKGNKEYTYQAARDELGISGKFRHSILCCGGSLGADAINSCVVEYVQKYLKDVNNVKVTHASGARNYEKVKKEAEERGIYNSEKYELVDYIYDMPRRMAAADVMICRAGAMTLSEIAMVGKPAVLIPSPNVTDNHQYKNAKVLSDDGCAELIEEKELTPALLCEKINLILSDRVKYAAMSEKLKKHAHKDANEIIYKELVKLVEKNAGRKQKN